MAYENSSLAVLCLTIHPGYRGELQIIRQQSNLSSLNIIIKLPLSPRSFRRLAFWTIVHYNLD